MSIDRRLLLAGGTAMAAGPVFAQVSTGLTSPLPTDSQMAAIKAIGAYAEAHIAHFGLPAMGITIVDGPFVMFLKTGKRDYLQTQKLRDDDLWQIGSISKSFVAVCALQMQGEGKLSLDDELRKHLPEAPLPGISSGGPFTLRGLLDHTTGLPDWGPGFTTDGSKLTRGFPAGSHWSYSNLGYNLVGAALERIDGKPLAAIIEARIARPLGMADTRGAIQWRDRARYPASYVPQRPDQMVRLKMPLAPAPWVDANLAAGSVASTLPDMARYLRWLIGVGAGNGGPVLSNDLARLWLARPVVQDPASPTETYGLGLMHREDEGRRLLHHTGGMVCFSSAFHVDPAAGTGAFASCAVGGLNYRPRLITQYAVKVLRLAREGKPLPAPPPLANPVARPAEFAGRYGALTVQPDLIASMAGASAALEPMQGDVFVTGLEPLAGLPLSFVRDAAGQVVAVDHGQSRWPRDGANALPLKPTPNRLLKRAGHYQSDDPWLGGFTLVARDGRLLMGGTEPLIEIEPDVWRVATPDWHPERLRFAGLVDGVPKLALVSGAVYERRAT